MTQPRVHVVKYKRMLRIARALMQGLAVTTRWICDDTGVSRSRAKADLNEVLMALPVEVNTGPYNQHNRRALRFVPRRRR